MRATIDPPSQSGVARRLSLVGVVFALLLVVVGCSDGSGSGTAASTGESVAVASGGASTIGSDASVGEEPTSTDLIQAALAVGEITAHEAVVYRVQAVFADPALPERFAGAPAADHVAVVEAWIELDKMPRKLADAVRPYLLRPTNPASAFAGGGRNQVAGAATPPTSMGMRMLHAVIPPAAADSGVGECKKWISQALSPAPFRVWACATAGRTEGSQILGEPLAGELSAMLQKMILKRPHGLGLPLPDVPDHREHRDLDELIDIYLLPTNAFAPLRAGYRAPMKPKTYGQAFPTDTSTPNHRGPGGSARSGYVIVNEALLTDRDEFLATVVHEVFHVQQFAQSVSIQPAITWFIESTATWAELYFGPRTHKDAYERHLPKMQRSLLELTATNPHDHQYQAHVWPLYMQQHAETGADSIFSVWESLADSSLQFAADDTLAYINRHVPWHEHYPQFAAQLLNLRLSGDPVAPYFTDVDERFPVDQTPDLTAMKRQHRLPGAKDPVLDYSNWAGEPLAPGVPGLGYRYDRIVIDPGSLPKTWGIKLIPDDRLKASGSAAWIDVLIREKEGSFRRVAVDPTSGGEWCDVLEMVVILSVPSPTGRVEGAMTASIDEAPLCALSGDLKLSVSGDYKSPILQLPAPNTATMQITGNLVVKLGAAQERPKNGARVLPPDVRKRLGLPDPEMERFYPDSGSQWSVTGSMVESTCVRYTFDCSTVDATAFTAGDPSRIKLEVIEEDGELTLVGSVPVVETVTPHLPPGQKVRTRQTSWQLVCHTGGSFGASVTKSPGHVFLGGTQGSKPLGGTRIPGENRVKAHCDTTWSAYSYQGDHLGEGEVSTIREIWTGEFTLGS